MKRRKLSSIIRSRFLPLYSSPSNFATGRGIFTHSAKATSKIYNLHTAGATSPQEYYRATSSQGNIRLYSKIMRELGPAAVLAVRSSGLMYRRACEWSYSAPRESLLSGINVIRRIIQGGIGPRGPSRYKANELFLSSSWRRATRAPRANVCTQLRKHRPVIRSRKFKGSSLNWYADGSRMDVPVVRSGENFE